MLTVHFNLLLCVYALLAASVLLNSNVHENDFNKTLHNADQQGIHSITETTCSPIISRMQE